MKLLRCYSQAPDLAILEGNMNEAITVYLKAMLLEAPLLSFTRTWQVKVTTWTKLRFVPSMELQGCCSQAHNLPIHRFKGLWK